MTPHIWVPSAADDVEHLVGDADHLRGTVTGHFRTACGRTIRAGSLLVAPAARCPSCGVRAAGGRGRPMARAR
jgi:hypothetical protein